MPLQTARTGSERGVRASLKRATGPYSTTSPSKVALERSCVASMSSSTPAESLPDRELSK